MNAGAHKCPCCRRTVTRTRNHHICGHYDTAHNVCPGSYSSWDIALHENPEIPPKGIPA